MTYVYEFDGFEIQIIRVQIGTAYPKNGNVGNPTRYYQWQALVDGRSLGGTFKTRASAYEHARADILGIPYYDHENYPTRWVNVRYFQDVAREMKVTYRRRSVDPVAHRGTLTS